MPSRSQLVFSGLCIGAALLLLGALVVRIANAVDLLRWWTPVCLVGGILAADFLSGLLHWSADTWGRADLPIIGRHVLLPFRVHHLAPDDIARRGVLDTNGEVAGLAVPVLLGLMILPLDSVWREAVAVFGLGLCAMGAMTNQIHQWAHGASPPTLVRVLQTLGVLLRPGDHASHHAGRYDAHYCITTGWCNRPLEALGFFRRLERAITRVTGANPRHDEQFRGLAEGAHAGVEEHG